MQIIYVCFFCFFMFFLFLGLAWKIQLYGKGELKIRVTALTNSKLFKKEKIFIDYFLFRHIVFCLRCEMPKLVILKTFHI